ncbi:MAG: hypothetical protein OHK0041_05860 [Anaerolineales bacterium]
MKEYNFYVYILTNWNNKVMYVGMTNDLERRLYEHKNKLVDGFSKKYNVNKLAILNIQPMSTLRWQGKRRSKSGAGKRRTILLRP